MALEGWGDTWLHYRKKQRVRSIPPVPIPSTYCRASDAVMEDATAVDDSVSAPVAPATAASTDVKTQQAPGGASGGGAGKKKKKGKK